MMRIKNNGCPFPLPLLASPPFSLLLSLPCRASSPVSLSFSSRSPIPSLLVSSFPVLIFLFPLPPPPPSSLPPVLSSFYLLLSSFSFPFFSIAHPSPPLPSSSPLLFPFVRETLIGLTKGEVLFFLVRTQLDVVNTYMHI